jgi:ubiquinone/menaquinone biosynthesis C-methylase UbiE
VTSADRSFTPAAGSFAGVRYYDLLVRLLTREGIWRPKLLDLIAPQPGQTIVEVGCGSGTLAVAIKRRCPSATVIAIDPDPAVLEIARHKADAAGTAIDFRQGFLDEQGILPGSVDTAYCSLVLHQVPVATKTALINQLADLLAPRGRMHIADYGQQSGLMRMLFRMTVQQADGLADTQPNADGLLEHLLANARFTPIGSDSRIATPSGTIALFTRTFRDDKESNKR